MGFFSNVVEALKINGDDEEDDLLYEEEMGYEKPKKEKKIKEKKERAPRKRRVEEYDYDQYDDEPDDYRRDRDYESRNSVPPRSPETSYDPNAFRRTEIEIFKTYRFEDAQEVCDRLLAGDAVIVNFESASPADAQRIMDFVFGCVYSINGFFRPMSEVSFLISPVEIDINRIAPRSYNNSPVPTFNRMI